MSGTTTPRKRNLEDDLPSFDDPADLVNAVISTLQQPEDRTNVANNYANDKNHATEIQAYAKIAGQDWTFYVKSLAVSIGRNTDNPGAANNSNTPLIDIDLGPAKVVSRQHATITYNIDLSCWELKVLGRNGAKIDGQKMPVGIQHATPLHLGAILDIGGTQMIFILPDSPPDILPKMLSTCLSKYKSNMNKVRKSSSSSYSHSGPVKSFQMFDKAQLTHSPSSVSASSLQNNLDQDLSKVEAKDIKPPYSYATMITQAILSNDDGVMSLSDIYNWISDHYAYYKYSKTGWQNSIRHNLSLNKAFEKVPRRPNEPGKGMKWQISESYKQDFLNKIQNGSLLKTRRGSSVSRQLQLHLATHQQLPDTQKYFDKNEKANSQPPQSTHQQSQPPQLHQRSDSYDYRFSHSRNNSIPNLGQPMQYPGIPNNPIQSNPLSYLNQPNGGFMGIPPNASRAYSPYQPVAAPAHFMYGTSMLNQSAPPPPIQQQLQPQHNNANIYLAQQQQHQQPQPQPQQPQPQPSQQVPSAPQNSLNKPKSNEDNQASDQKTKSELSSPMRQESNLNSTTPKLPKVTSGGHLFNLPPPSSNSHNVGSSAPQAHHSRLHSYNNNTNGGQDTGNSFGNSTNNPNSSESNQNNTTGQTNNTSEFGMGFTSPKKIAPLEAFTPERGSKSNGANKLGVPNGSNTNQSSPAFWNFVQFSTPNAQTPLRKNSDELNSQGSPTLSRKNLSNGLKNEDDLNNNDEENENGVSTNDDGSPSEKADVKIELDSKSDLNSRKDEPVST
ncbi:hypothetical protein HYPBUDRAFT_161864 [Hyphopichia burtonii NRRL Y-1933]|uniref:Uncharacterized protein n=1 Tax=Hyphopichia burtonii NRRL Y-1933 TaxID=984485 RepID=A0A1E4RIP7_9ASCO|nr:hypothetical protein HYPBUDRAFT_161864 [Hyphopichia burtonii NRRL Y-1933]ODV66975.1 hypothetical protein HYPBUDRAFT_161864 [Hyphopichia burtonii NRRL Y-1933]